MGITLKQYLEGKPSWKERNIKGSKNRRGKEVARPTYRSATKMGFLQRIENKTKRAKWEIASDGNYNLSIKNI